MENEIINMSCMKARDVSVCLYDSAIFQDQKHVQGVVVPVFQGKLKYQEAIPFSEIFSEKDARLVRDFLNSRIFLGEEGSVLYVPISSGQLVYVVGLGAVEQCSYERFRRIGSYVYATLQAHHVSRVAFFVPSSFIQELRSNCSDQELVRAYAEGVMLSTYSFQKYKSFEKQSFFLRSILFVVERDVKPFQTVVQEAVTICDVVCEMRDVVNDSSDEVTPHSFSRIVQRYGKEDGFRVAVMNEKAIDEKGLRLLSAVGRASAHPPRFVVATYKGKGANVSKEPIALVGKGITYDTGGVNLKPSNGGYLDQMHTDMAGAATVLGALVIAVKLQLPVSLVAIMPLAENALSGESYKPGSVLKSYKGDTVEIINTDAEGRLLLADALTYAVKDMKAAQVIDVATLTGACMIALGSCCAGIVSNNDQLTESLSSAGEATYERVWRLPLFEEYRQDMKSSVADIRSLGKLGGGQYAGAITAAAFLHRFINHDTSWAHIDIAGTGYIEQRSHYSGPGATGFGIRLLIEYLKKTARVL